MEGFIRLADSFKGLTVNLEGLTTDLASFTVGLGSVTWNSKSLPEVSERLTLDLQSITELWKALT